MAGILELGRLLRLNPPSGSVELVAYALEEPPWFGGPQMGSAVHAASLRNDYDRMAKVVTGVFAAVRALAGS